MHPGYDPESTECVGNIFNIPCEPRDSNFTYRKNDGLAGSLDRIEAIGDGQVPAVAAFAWRRLMSAILQEVEV